MCYGMLCYMGWDWHVVDFALEYLLCSGAANKYKRV